MLTNSKRTATVRAMNYCTCASLKQADFNELCENFPETLQKLKQGMLRYQDKWKLYKKVIKQRFKSNRAFSFELTTFQLSPFKPLKSWFTQWKMNFSKQARSLFRKALCFPRCTSLWMGKLMLSFALRTKRTWC